MNSAMIQWNRPTTRPVDTYVTRYVTADLEQVGAELTRRAAEINEWLDAMAARDPTAPAADPATATLASAIARVDLDVYQALSSAAARLTAAGHALTACADDMRGVDAEIARRMCRWDG